MLGKLEGTIIRNRYKYCSINLIVSLILLFVVNAGGLDENYTLMRAYSFWSLLVGIMLLITELKSENFSIMLIFVIGAFSRLFYPSIDMANGALGGEKYYGFFDYTDYLFPTILAMNIYYMLFIIAFTYFCKGKVISLNIDSLSVTGKYLFPIVVALYALGVVGRFFPFLFTFSTTIEIFISKLPTLVLMILSFYCSKSDNKSMRLFFLFLVISEIIYSVVWGFHKSPIIMDFLFLLLYLYLRKKKQGKLILTPTFIATSVITFYFTVQFVFPFISLKRTVAGFDPLYGATRDYSNMEIIQQVLQSGSTESKSASDEYGLVWRLNAINSNAYVYKGADIKGHDSNVLIQGLLSTIPQPLRPGLQIESQGIMIQQYWESGTTKVNASSTRSGMYTGAFGGAYFWGGWPAAILLCIFNAFCIFAILKYCLRWKNNLFALFILLTLVFNMLSCFEEVHDGGLTSDINYLYSAFFIFLFNKIFHIKPTIEHSHVIKTYGRTCTN